MLTPINAPQVRPGARAREPDSKPVKRVSRVEPVRASTRKREQLVRELERREHELRQSAALRAEGKGGQAARAYVAAERAPPGVIVDERG